MYTGFLDWLSQEEDRGFQISLLHYPLKFSLPQICSPQHDFLLFLVHVFVSASHLSTQSCVLVLAINLFSACQYASYLSRDVNWTSLYQSSALNCGKTLVLSRQGTSPTTAALRGQFWLLFCLEAVEKSTTVILNLNYKKVCVNPG